MDVPTVHTLLCFGNPFDVKVSLVISLFKGFSVVGLASERFFLENTKHCSGPAAWALCTGTIGLGTDLDAGAGMGLSLMASRVVCHCARESRSASCPRWGHRLNNLGALYEFSFLFFLLFSDLTLTHNSSLSGCLERLSV